MQRRQMMRRTAALAGCALLAPPWAGAQAAADYPRAGTALRYVVPFPPGGLTDTMARTLAQQLGERWKASVVVDNRPGSGGQIGADMVAKAVPDGHTLLAITLSHAANATLFPKAAYDLRRDLRPVALLAGSPMLIVVPAASPVRTLKDLVPLAQQRALSAGSSGNGTPPHLTLALFNDLNKTSIQHVPYKGGAPSMTDLIGGQLDVVFSNFPESVAHVKGGRLRALAVTTEARHPALPDVPTTAEAGMPALAVQNWTALMVPARTPDAVVQKLGDEVLQIMRLPEIEERARQQGFNVDARGPQAFGDFLAQEIARWAGVINAAGIRAD